MYDLFSLASILAFVTTIITFGRLLDTLLLKRHRAVLDKTSLQLWSFLEELSLWQIPRAGISLYVSYVTKLLGTEFKLKFFIKALLLSIALTLLIFFPFRALTLFLQAGCGTGITLSEAWNAAVSYQVRYRLPQLVVINFVFDFTTLFVTITLLRLSLASPPLRSVALVTADLSACLALWIAVMVLSEFFDDLISVFGSPISFASILSGLHSLIQFWSLPTCNGIYIYGTRTLLGATVIIPTVLYLATILFLLLLYLGFSLSRWIGMHVLEKSVEDEKKSIISHAATTLALVVLIASAFGLEPTETPELQQRRNSCISSESGCSGLVAFFNDGQVGRCYRYFEAASSRNIDFCLAAGESRTLSVGHNDGVYCNEQNTPPTSCDEFYVETGIETWCSCN